MCTCSSSEAKVDAGALVWSVLVESGSLVRRGSSSSRRGGRGQKAQKSVSRNIVKSTK